MEAVLFQVEVEFEQIQAHQRAGFAALGHACDQNVDGLFLPPQRDKELSLLADVFQLFGIHSALYWGHAGRKINRPFCVRQRGNLQRAPS